jgi:dephospho-CoA kinase
MIGMIWGITGCVGAGKSTAAGILESLGARVLDLDRVAAKAVTESSLGLTPAQALTQVVTAGPDRARIEAAILPIVIRRVEAWCAESTQTGVLDAALLFEHGLDRFCDVTVCVCCPIGERRERVLKRSTASAQLFDAIDSAQWSEEQKAELARFRIGSAEEIRSIWSALSPTLSPAGRGSK